MELELGGENISFNHSYSEITNHELGREVEMATLAEGGLRRQHGGNLRSMLDKFELVPIGGTEEEFRDVVNNLETYSPFGVPKCSPWIRDFDKKRKFSKGELYSTSPGRLNVPNLREDGRLYTIADLANLGRMLVYDGTLMDIYFDLACLHNFGRHDGTYMVNTKVLEGRYGRLPGMGHIGM